MSFTQKVIDLEFQLGEGNFGDTGTNTKLITGLRVSAKISKAGGVGMTQASIRVWGLSRDDFNTLTILGKPLVAQRRNIVTVYAGDEVTGTAVAFSGVITESWPNLNDAPQGYLAIEAFTSIEQAMAPAPPSSFNGPVDVAVLLAGLAQQMGFSFQNNGVQGIILQSPYYPGTLRDQAYAAADHAHINIFIDETTPNQAPNDASPPPSGGSGDDTSQSPAGVLAIWPQGGTRGGAVVELGPDTGMVGYPTCTPKGIVVTSVYNPNIAFGGQIKVNSIITVANGTWNIFSVEHELESQLPNGKWFTQVQTNVLGHETPIGGD